MTGDLENVWGSRALWGHNPPATHAQHLGYVYDGVNMHLALKNAFQSTCPTYWKECEQNCRDGQCVSDPTQAVDDECKEPWIQTLRPSVKNQNPQCEHPRARAGGWDEGKGALEMGGGVWIHEGKKHSGHREIHCRSTQPSLQGKCECRWSPAFDVRDWLCRLNIQANQPGAKDYDVVWLVANCWCGEGEC